MCVPAFRGHCVVCVRSLSKILLPPGSLPPPERQTGLAPGLSPRLSRKASAKVRTFRGTRKRFGDFFSCGGVFYGFSGYAGRGRGRTHYYIYIIGEVFPWRSSDGAAGVLCRSSGIALPLGRENCAAEAGELCHGGGNAVPLRCVLRTYPPYAVFGKKSVIPSSACPGLCLTAC